MISLQELRNHLKELGEPLRQEIQNSIVKFESANPEIRVGMVVHYTHSRNKNNQIMLRLEYKGVVETEIEGTDEPLTDDAAEIQQPGDETVGPEDFGGTEYEAHDFDTKNIDL